MTDAYHRVEHAYEAQFANEAERAFRLRARRDKLFGRWVALKLQLDEAAADDYARAMAGLAVQSGDNEPLIRAALDLAAAGLDIADAEIAAAYRECADQAALALEPRAQP